MTGENQYLRIDLGSAAFLLPSRASLAIEQRENLSVNEVGGSMASAWRVAGLDRWPAFRLDQDLRRHSGGDWRRAVFLESEPHPVGLIADEIQLLELSEVLVEPLTPLGIVPTRKGHLFSGAWVSGAQLLLVFEPVALAAFLSQMEAQQ